MDEQGMTNPIFRIALNTYDQSNKNQNIENLESSFDQNMTIQNSFSLDNQMINQNSFIMDNQMINQNSFIMDNQMINQNSFIMDNQMTNQNSFSMDNPMMNQNMSMNQGNMMSNQMMNQNINMMMNMNQGNMMNMNQENMMSQIMNNQMMMNNSIFNGNIDINSSQSKDNQIKANIGEFITVIFRASGGGVLGKKHPFYIQAKLDEKVYELIERYRIKSQDNCMTKKFIFNAKNLDFSLTVIEAGLTNNANIFVVQTDGIKGAGGSWYNKEINIKFIKSSKIYDNKITNCQLNGLLKLCLLKEISSKLNDDELIKLP